MERDQNPRIVGCELQFSEGEAAISLDVAATILDRSKAKRRSGAREARVIRVQASSDGSRQGPETAKQGRQRRKRVAVENPSDRAESKGARAAKVVAVVMAALAVFLVVCPRFVESAIAVGITT